MLRKDIAENAKKFEEKKSVVEEKNFDSNSKLIIGLFTLKIIGPLLMIIAVILQFYTNNKLLLCILGACVSILYFLIFLLEKKITMRGSIYDLLISIMWITNCIIFISN